MPWLNFACTERSEQLEKVRSHLCVAWPANDASKFDFRPASAEFNVQVDSKTIEPIAGESISSNICGMLLHACPS